VRARKGATLACYHHFKRCRAWRLRFRSIDVRHRQEELMAKGNNARKKETKKPKKDKGGKK
jgi:hypothetical protein